jgi:hypothetical protein
MRAETRRSLYRRQFVCGCCAGAVIGFIPTIAQGADEIVPVNREPRHHERFRNEYIRAMEVNQSPQPYWLIAFEIIMPEPGKFSRSSRVDAPAYSSELDNNRLHIWRLRLDPGQTAAAISDAGPGLRVVLRGDQLTETPGSAPFQEVALKQGDFAWQPAGVRPEIRNSGRTHIELVDFELH